MVGLVALRREAPRRAEQRRLWDTPFRLPPLRDGRGFRNPTTANGKKVRCVGPRHLTRHLQTTTAGCTLLQLQFR